MRLNPNSFTNPRTSESTSTPTFRFNNNIINKSFQNPTANSMNNSKQNLSYKLSQTSQEQRPMNPIQLTSNVLFDTQQPKISKNIFSPIKLECQKLVFKKIFQWTILLQLCNFFALSFFTYIILLLPYNMFSFINNYPNLKQPFNQLIFYLILMSIGRTLKYYLQGNVPTHRLQNFYHNGNKNQILLTLIFLIYEFVCLYHIQRDFMRCIGYSEKITNLFAILIAIEFVYNGGYLEKNKNITQKCKNFYPMILVNGLNPFFKRSHYIKMAKYVILTLIAQFILQLVCSQFNLEYILPTFTKQQNFNSIIQSIFKQFLIRFCIFNIIKLVQKWTQNLIIGKSLYFLKYDLYYSQLFVYLLMQEMPDKNNTNSEQFSLFMMKQKEMSFMIYFNPSLITSFQRQALRLIEDEFLVDESINLDREIKNNEYFDKKMFQWESIKFYCKNELDYLKEHTIKMNYFLQTNASQQNSLRYQKKFFFLNNFFQSIIQWQDNNQTFSVYLYHLGKAVYIMEMIYNLFRNTEIKIQQELDKNEQNNYKLINYQRRLNQLNLITSKKDLLHQVNLVLDKLNYFYYSSQFDEQSSLTKYRHRLCETKMQLEKA